MKTPVVLLAMNPRYGLEFFRTNGMSGYLVLGAVFLVATGAEALYADLGHFGVTPIRIDWILIVAPALLLNYFGQGSLLLRSPEAARNPFYLMAPEWMLFPLVILATFATVIASQAVISGVFSLTRQAIQLGFLPRMRIVHTSEREIGQIYMPGPNWALMFATIVLVLGFRSSSNLAAAYGVAVTATMIITTLLAFVVATRIWKWPLLPTAVLTGVFLAIDLSFFGANIIKVAQGGWFPLLVAGCVLSAFVVWKWGKKTLSDKGASTIPLQLVIDDVVRRDIVRVPGTAVFLTSDSMGTPTAFLHNIKHNKVVHDRNILLTVVGDDAPRVPASRRVHVEDLGSRFYRVTALYGFVEDPDIPTVLFGLAGDDLQLDPGEVTYFMSRSTVVSSGRNLLLRMRDFLFIVMTRNALNPVYFFQIPPNRVVELGLVQEI